MPSVATSGPGLVSAISGWPFPGTLLATNFDVSIAALNAFLEQERILDEMEELSLTEVGADSLDPPSPSYWASPATIMAARSSHPPRLPLLPLTNITPSVLQPAQLTRTQKRNRKRRGKLTALEKEAAIYAHRKERRRDKKVAVSLSCQIRVDFPLSAFPVSEDDGLTGHPRNLQRGDRVVRTVEYFHQHGFRLIDWDGVFVHLIPPTPKCSRPLEHLGP